MNRGLRGKRKESAEEEFRVIRPFNEIRDSKTVKDHQYMQPSSKSNKGYEFGETTGRVIGAALEVHKTLGPGFQEVVYQRALALELEVAGLEFTREDKVPVFYKDRQIDTRRVDFVIEDCIIEIKARSSFAPEDFIQTLSYLKASHFKIALLINFGAAKLEVKRLVNERG